MPEQEKEKKEPKKGTEAGKREIETENSEQKEKKEPEQEKISVNEERIRRIAISYYSRPDIRKNMLEFSKNRECVPRYFEGFGKRPDVFNFESDIIELAKKGATSFHCSQELWTDPLRLSLDMKQEDIKKLRAGWDLIIDVDSKYLDYSKAYAQILVEVLNNHGIKNIGVKFSGSKGLHIIIPSKAFPQEMSGMKTNEMFPEWPRLICRYLSRKVLEKEKFRENVLEFNIDNNEKGDAKEEKHIETYCKNCNNPAEKTNIVYFECRACKTKTESTEDSIKRKRIIRCPNPDCNIEMTEVRREEVFICKKCNINSKRNPSNFNQRVQSKHIDADIILVSPRHLFRMPYSLHEKTSLSSVVIDAYKIKDFDMKDANPLKVKPINFIPDSEQGEATQLLREALEFKFPEENLKENDYEKIEKSQNKNIGEKKFKDITITNLTPDLYPPTIKKIMQGMPEDGRKRALFILLSFFKSLKLSDDEIRVIIEEWNKKNYEPLKSGYVNAQLSWYSKSTPKMPPNFDKSYYKEIGLNPTEEELKAKNPVSYVIKKSLSRDFFNKGKNQ